LAAIGQSDPVHTITLSSVETAPLLAANATRLDL
jgi:hypothetical protein